MKPLSPTQNRIVLLASKGMADKAIASELSMKWGTVREHWKRIMLKLGAHTRVEAVLISMLTPIAPCPANACQQYAGKTGKDK